tara:strand:+ start:21018 stop:21566 length:549 start_codon:yes stop_codon:yes gene_type:complete
MQITQFNIDSNTLVLTITNASSAFLLRLWTDKTYKDFSKAIDLTAKLTGSATETITITLADLGETIIDGIYFIEVEDANEVSTAYTSNLIKYKECILDKIIKNIQCKSCLDYFDQDTINAHSLLIATEYSLELGYIEVALNNLKALNKYCSNACQSCGSFSNVIDIDLFSLNDPQIIDLGDA